MSEQEIVLEITVVVEGQVVDTLELSDDKIKIGNLATSQVRLDDPSVSRIHAVLEDKGDGQYQAIDLGSASGTYVNGDKITKQMVGDGDTLGVGQYELQLAVVDLAARRRQEEAQAQAAAQAAAAEVPEGWVRLEDGSMVEAFTMEGYYDDAGNYIPGYYDYDGTYHYGYGYFDDEGEWQVAHGFYDPEGEWVPTEAPREDISDTELYTENFFSDRGGPVLEIAHLWTDTVHQVNTYKTPQSVVIGSEESNEYVVAGNHFGEAQFPLVVYDDKSGYRLNLLPSMEGQVQRGDQSMSLQELMAQPSTKESRDFKGAKTLELGRGTKVRIDLGPNTFLIHFTKMPAAVAGGGSLDRAPFVYQSISLALHVAFMLLVFMLPDGYGGLELYDHQAADRFAELAMEPEEEEEEEELDEDWLDDVEDADEVEAEAPDEDEVVEDEEIQVEGDEDVDDSEMQVARDREIAADTGALAAFSGDRQDALGGDAQTALAALDTEHSASGVGGLGLAGAGRGGAEGEEGFGRADVGTGGSGTGGAPDAELDERDTLEPQVIPEDPVTTGALDREIIQRVVRQHRREIQHCYEQQLQRNPDLAGRVTMQWVISPTGDVVSASVEETSLNDSNVEQCMVQRIQRWSFPEPDGGGIVRVNYPFNFSA